MQPLNQFFQSNKRPNGLQSTVKRNDGTTFSYFKIYGTSKKQKHLLISSAKKNDGYIFWELTTTFWNVIQKKRDLLDCISGARESMSRKFFNIFDVSKFGGTATSRDNFPTTMYAMYCPLEFVVSSTTSQISWTSISIFSNY